MGIRIISLLIGYAFGCVLTGEIVAKKLTGGSASGIGTTGNPGMANIMANLGFWPGLAVLAGDLAKCAAACAAAGLLYGSTGVLYAGLGCTLGHDYPFWRRFSGGKGVATSCLAFFLYHPLWGGLSSIIGMLTVFATQYLCIGAAVSPAAFTILCLASGHREAAWVGIFCTVLSILRNIRSLKGIRSGETEKNDVPGAIARAAAKIMKRKE